MFDDILELFDRRRHQRERDRPSSAPQPGLPFDLPFLNHADEAEDEPGRQRRHDDRDRRSRPSSDRSRHDDDWC